MSSKTFSVERAADASGTPLVAQLDPRQKSGVPLYRGFVIERNKYAKRHEKLDHTK